MEVQMTHLQGLEKTKSGTKRIMRDFTITEISAVDKPAQEGARMTILKRADPKWKEMSDFEKRVAIIRKRDACTGTGNLDSAHGQCSVTSDPRPLDHQPMGGGRGAVG